MQARFQLQSNGRPLQTSFLVCQWLTLLIKNTKRYMFCSVTY